MLNLLINADGRGICVRDTDSIVPQSPHQARVVSLDQYSNTHLLPRILARPRDYIVTRYVSETDFDLALRDPDPISQEALDRRAEMEARRA